MGLGGSMVLLSKERHSAVDGEPGKLALVLEALASTNQISRRSALTGLSNNW